MGITWETNQQKGASKNKKPSIEGFLTSCLEARAGVESGHRAKEHLYLEVNHAFHIINNLLDDVLGSGGVLNQVALT